MSQQVRSTVVGSWPKPEWLFNGLPSHSGNGEGVKSGFVKGVTEEMRDRATKEAIDDQLNAGLMNVSDENYIFYQLKRGFSGIDFETRTKHVQRGGHETTMAPTITGKIQAKETGFLVDDYLKAKALVPDGTDLVVTMPGPMTVMDTVHNSFYDNEQQLAKDIAEVLRAEALLLIEAGVKYLSVDEPVFVRYPNQVSEWGVKMLDVLLKDLDCFKAVHICCSYPTCPQKADCRLYQDIVDQLCTSYLDAVSIEYAEREFDLEEVLVPLGKAGKSVILGVCRVHEEVETVELIKERARKALRHLPASQLLLAPDCGLVCISRDQAIQKMTNIAQATTELNAELAKAD